MGRDQQISRNCYIDAVQTSKKDKRYGEQRSVDDEEV